MRILGARNNDSQNRWKIRSDEFVQLLLRLRKYTAINICDLYTEESSVQAFTCIGQMFQR